MVVAVAVVAAAVAAAEADDNMAERNRRCRDIKAGSSSLCNQ